MANIDTYLAAIRNAIYGEQVRTAICNAISAINTEVTTWTGLQDGSVTTSKIYNGAVTQAKLSSDLNTMINAMKTGFDGVVYSSPAAMVTGEDQKLQDQITEINTEIRAFEKQVLFVLGGLSSSDGSEVSRNDRSRSGFLRFRPNMFFINKTGIGVHYYFYNSAQVFVGYTSASYATDIDGQTLLQSAGIQEAYYVRLLARSGSTETLNNKATGMFYIDDFSELVSEVQNISMVKIPFEVGGLVSSTGIDTYRTDRRRSRYIPIENSFRISVKFSATGKYLYVYLYDNNMQFIQYLNDIRYLIPKDVIHNTDMIGVVDLSAYPSAKYVRFVSTDIDHVSDSAFGVWLYNAGVISNFIISDNLNLIDTKQITGINNTAFNITARIGYDVYAADTPPQQSISSFALAYRKGYRTMLCDCQITADGVPVCWHDIDLGATLNTNYVRHSDGSTLSAEEKALLIRNLTISELDGYDFGIYKGAQYSGTKILRLEDFVKFCKAMNVTIVLETKQKMNAGAVSTIAHIVNKYGIQNQFVWAFDDTYDDSNSVALVMNAIPSSIVLIRRIGSAETVTSTIAMADMIKESYPNADINITVVTNGLPYLTDEVLQTIANKGIRLYYSEIQGLDAMQSFVSDGYVYLFRWIACRTDINRYMREFYNIE